MDGVRLGVRCTVDGVRFGVRDVQWMVLSLE